MMESNGCSIALRVAEIQRKSACLSQVPACDEWLNFNSFRRPLSGNSWLTERTARARANGWTRLRSGAVTIRTRILLMSLMRSSHFLYAESALLELQTKVS